MKGIKLWRFYVVWYKCERQHIPYYKFTATNWNTWAFIKEWGKLHAWIQTKSYNIHACVLVGKKTPQFIYVDEAKVLK